MLKTTIVLSATFAMIAIAGAAPAASHAINIAPVRAYVQKQLVNARTNTLKLGKQLNPAKPGAGITAAAVKKATQTLTGLTGFNSGMKAGNYVAKMGKEMLIITASAPGQKVEGTGYESDNARQQFVIRTGKSGLVIARGELAKDTGALTWTRSHNGEKPAERTK